MVLGRNGEWLEFETEKYLETDKYLKKKKRCKKK